MSEENIPLQENAAFEGEDGEEENVEEENNNEERIIFESVPNEENEENEDERRSGENGQPIDENETLSWKIGTGRLIGVSAPVILTYVLEMLPGLANVIFVGQFLDEVNLAAVGLASMYCNVTGISVGFGLASAMDTLCSQAYGANNKKGVGLVLQRALLIKLVLCIPIAFLWIFAEDILNALGQDPMISHLSGNYCRIMLIGLYPLFIYEVLKKYLQGQKIVVPQFLVAVLSNIWTIFANWFFIDYIGMGFNGAPVARATTCFILAIFMVGYVLIFKKYKETWDGWSKQAFKQWGEYLKLGIPGMLMLCLEWWAFEIATFEAGIIGEAELASHAIILNISSVTFFFPYGAAVAASVLIGNSLGAGNKFFAKRYAQIAMIFAVAIEIVNAVLLIALKEYLPYIFTNDQTVIDITSTLLPLAAAFQIFDGLQAVSGGILRGCGRQIVGAIYYFVSYYIIGLPIGTILAFVAGMSLLGLWIGLTVGLLVTAMIATTIVLRTDWEKQVRAASDRIEVIFH